MPDLNPRSKTPTRRVDLDHEVPLAMPSWSWGGVASLILCGVAILGGMIFIAWKVAGYLVN